MSKKLKCAANVNLAFAFDLRNFEDVTYKHFYAHENNTILDGEVCTCLDFKQDEQSDREANSDRERKWISLII